MIRWFADLPIERKLRVVIMVPATVAFAIALTMHVATNLLHLREDMLRRGARAARGIGGTEPSAGSRLFRRRLVRLGRRLRRGLLRAAERRRTVCLVAHHVPAPDRTVRRGDPDSLG